MGNFQQIVTETQMSVNNERLYVDKNFTDIEQTLLVLMHQMIIAEETTKNQNRMQSELQRLNQEMVAIRESQTTLKDFIQNMVEKIENLAQAYEYIGEIVERTMLSEGHRSQIKEIPSLTSMQM